MYTFHMVSHSAHFRKHFVTVEAFERFLAQVYVHVRSEVVLGGKAFLAHTTWMWFIISVQFQVLAQIRFLIECFQADFASEWPLARMNA